MQFTVFIRALALSLCLTAPINAMASNTSPSFGDTVFGGTFLGLYAVAKTCYDTHGNLQPRCQNQALRPAVSDPILRNAHTAKLRDALNVEQIAAGQPPDPEDCDAHHIVPKREGRLWAAESADAARSVLESCQIDLDSADNGIYLPNKISGSQCKGSYHKTLHTARYYKDIAQRLGKARKYGCKNVTNELRAIKHDLLRGVY